MKTLIAVLILPAALMAQDTVAPTADEQTGPARGENVGDYNVVQSWEFGYRYALVGGSQEEYRADVNYHDGIRLLGSSLTVNSRDGHGRWFDEIVLTTQGLGNDPYESAVLRVRKNKLYRYDMLWRQNDYFNPGYAIAGGEHLQDTVYRTQDHEITLLPESAIRFHAGYSRVTQDGPALTTIQEFDNKSPVYPVFQNTRQQFDDYRVGADGTFKGFRFTVQRRWEYFREDSAYNTTQGIDFNRSAPYRGQTPGWMGNLTGEFKWVAINARATYAGGRGDFIQNDSATGLDRFGNMQNQQIVVTGNGDRPVTTGDFSVTLFPVDRFSIVNNTSVANIRMSGNNAFAELSNGTPLFNSTDFQLLTMRLVTNTSTGRYRFSKRLDVFGGFSYSDRLIQSYEFGTSAEQTNHTKAGTAGVNWIAVKNLRLHLEGEIGRNDNPFTPISLRNYHAIRSRAQYRARALTLGARYEEAYNNNSIQITAYSSRARTYSADASFAARSWLSFDTSYSRLHLDTIGGIAFFQGAPFAQLTTGTSVYISNLHAYNLGARFALGKRADLYTGYTLTKDTGPSFPLTYHSPLVRLSFRINEKLRYNLGYQYYGYHEQFGLFSTYENFHANTGYTSLLWSF
ncbi:MAG: hypothetical protein KGN84_10000 [Acidobacteriota bacterium]|nr:hypothetical protein [Acidobacteriota bacterium]